MAPGRLPGAIVVSEVFVGACIAAGIEVGGSWMVFWIQLPLLVLALAVVVAATIALRRARPEDIPKVFESFASAFVRRRRDSHGSITTTNRKQR